MMGAAGLFCRPAAFCLSDDTEAWWQTVKIDAGIILGIISLIGTIFGPMLKHLIDLRKERREDVVFEARVELEEAEKQAAISRQVQEMAQAWMVTQEERLRTQDERIRQQDEKLREYERRMTAQDSRILAMTRMESWHLGFMRYLYQGYSRLYDQIEQHGEEPSFVAMSFERWLSEQGIDVEDFRGGEHVAVEETG